jgi:putative PIN family toxin of toxin-antitoxin system
LSNVEIREVFSLLKEISIVVDPRKLGVSVSGVCRDKDDDNVIAGALAANVNYIVTGDNDLLVLRKYKGIKIISPRGFELLFTEA